MLGNFDGLQWNGFNLVGSGLAARNVFLKGKFVLENGSSIADSVFNDQLTGNEVFVSYASAVVDAQGNIIDISDKIGNIPAGKTVESMISQSASKIEMVIA
jgi:hypothetical protein